MGNTLHNSNSNVVTDRRYLVSDVASFGKVSSKSVPISSILVDKNCTSESTVQSVQNCLTYAANIEENS